MGWNRGWEMLAGSNYTMLSTPSLRQINRRARSPKASLFTSDGAGELFKGYEAQAAGSISDRLEKTVN